MAAVFSFRVEMGKELFAAVFFLRVGPIERPQHYSSDVRWMALSLPYWEYQTCFVFCERKMVGLWMVEEPFPLDQPFLRYCQPVEILSVMANRSPVFVDPF